MPPPRTPRMQCTYCGSGTRLSRGSGGSSSSDSSRGRGSSAAGGPASDLAAARAAARARRNSDSRIQSRFPRLQHRLPRLRRELARRSSCRCGARVGRPAQPLVRRWQGREGAGAAVLCDHGKGRRGRHQQNILCECPLTSQLLAGSCYEPPTKLKLGVGGPGAEGPGPHPPRGLAREAPSGSRRRRHRAAVRLAAKRRRLPGVREGASRAEAGDGAALQAVVGPPVEHRPALQLGAQVAGRR